MYARLDCRSCPEDMRDERGCKSDSRIPGRWDIDGERYQRCPRGLVTDQSYEYLQSYHFFKAGMLPQGNGWINESPKYLQAMMLIAAECSKWEEKAREK
jgi:hypothetical protein